MVRLELREEKKEKAGLNFRKSTSSCSRTKISFPEENSLPPPQVSCDGFAARGVKIALSTKNCIVQPDFHDVLCFHKPSVESGMEFAELIKTTRVDNVILRRAHTSLIEGTLGLTSHHLIFSSRVSEKDEMMVRLPDLALKL